MVAEMIGEWLKSRPPLTALSILPLLSLIFVAVQFGRAQDDLHHLGLRPLSSVERFPADGEFALEWAPEGIGVVLPFYWPFIGVPWWFAALLTGILPMRWLLHEDRWGVKAMRRQAGLCTECGFDIRASLYTCPECGADLTTQ